jgi:hypothetical protein
MKLWKGKFLGVVAERYKTMALRYEFSSLDLSLVKLHSHPVPRISLVLVRC